jgi:hypothetical protein
MSDVNHTDVLLEDINGKFDVVLEVVGQIQDQIKNLPTRDEFTELKDDVKTIKLAVTGHSERLSDHEKRIGQLETA